MAEHKPASARAKRVWQRLIEWYGTRLAEQYGETPPADWSEVVDNADNEAVKRALTVIRSKYVAHPPTFPQFAEAMAPVRKANGPRQPTVQDRLCEYVMRTIGTRLTPTQMRGPWTFRGRSFAAANSDDKTVEDQGIEILAVEIAPDGEHAGFRVAVEDMGAA